ncbi:MAG: hypothetical protein BGO51_25220 [Rhodospirillales bacterium 69-11]|nr:BrnA antitoxin family protein [Rhodospirillales bacterium]MBN8928146.1 BrnA antitoxin family protein [Rhodospirillales bacterium]OJW28187.1 MAG: hypothetical protein BGO51_25220 [Rhodospirillales bacterium 69-11]
MSRKPTSKERSEALAAARAAMSPDQLARLQAAAAQPDDTINLADPDAPEALDWSDATRGRFYRPRKILKTLRIDADVLAWFEAQGPGHLTRMNRVLRASMLRGIRRGKGGAVPAIRRRAK